MEFTCINGKWNCPTVPCQGLSEKGRIPRSWAEMAYKEYAAQYGMSQSFDRLNERGGLGADEIIGLLVDRLNRLEQKKEPTP
jgi:hypothetical protein